MIKPQNVDDLNDADDPAMEPADMCWLLAVFAVGLVCIAAAIVAVL